MTTITIKYVGLKTAGERAFSEQTGIVWFPGTVSPVAAAVAALMLQHPDVFARADGQPADPGTPGGTEVTGTPDAAATSAGSSDPFTDPTFMGTGAEVGKQAAADSQKAQEQAALAQDTSGISLAPGGTVAEQSPPTTGTATPDAQTLGAMNVDQLRQTVKDFSLSIAGYNLMGEDKLRNAVASALAGAQ